TSPASTSPGSGACGSRTTSSSRRACRKSSPRPPGTSSPSARTRPAVPELVLQERHPDEVHERPPFPQLVPPDALLHEPAALVHPDRPPVVVDHVEVHLVEPEALERVLEDGPHRVRAESLRPVLLLPDHDPEARLPVRPVDPVEPDVPDVVPVDLDRVDLLVDLRAILCEPP